MKDFIFAGLCLWGALLIEGCPPMPPVVPVPDADASGLSDNALADITAEAKSPDVYDRACAHKLELGCADLSGGHCAKVFREEVASGHFIMTKATADCVVAAQTKDSVRLCAGIKCP